MTDHSQCPALIKEIRNLHGLLNQTQEQAKRATQRANNAERDRLELRRGMESKERQIKALEARLPILAVDKNYVRGLVEWLTVIVDKAIRERHDDGPAGIRETLAVIRTLKRAVGDEVSRGPRRQERADDRGEPEGPGAETGVRRVQDRGDEGDT